MEINDYKAKPDKTIKEHCQDLINQLEILKEYGYLEDRKLYELIKYACFHHDDGKANEEFQKRVKSKKLRFNKEREVPHNVLSAYMVNPQDFSSKDDYYKVLHAILNHHDYGDVFEIIKDKKELIQYLLRDLDSYQISGRTIPKLAGIVKDLEAIKIKGFLHKCDYSASGHYTAEYPNDFLEYSMDNIKIKWRSVNPSSDWNSMQKFCIDKRDENIIIIAQTGMGKTEAGLQWIGNHKGYFVLPLRTAINAIYDRVRKEIIQNVDLEKRLCILHSESLEYYTEKLDDTEFDLFEYENKGRQLSMPLSISTMDQLFDFIFMYQGFELKLTMLSYSKIVIDEIQMYDPELLAYLICGLKLISQMGGKIAIMTATLSPFVKTLLMRAIPFQEENIKTFVDDSIRHHIAVKDCKLNIEDIFEKYVDNEQISKSNKILVVCNTIRKAQELYQKLKAYADENSIESLNLHMLHSRYTREDRSILEKEILDFGKTYADDKHLDVQSGIWISTSLVEASLDIDFDYLFTELQDLNSLFQRLGRCNRKGKKNVLQPNCYIYTQIDPSTLSSGANGFIDETIFRLSKDALQTIDGKISETQKLELLDNYLTMENLKQSEYYRRYKKFTTIEDIQPYKFKKNEKRLRNILSENIIPSPIYELHKDEIRQWEQELSLNGLNHVDKIKLRANILQYSVSIPYYQWIVYRNAANKGDAASYPEISIGQRESICVMECLYDEMGFQMMNYKNIVRPTEFL